MYTSHLFSLKQDGVGVIVSALRMRESRLLPQETPQRLHAARLGAGTRTKAGLRRPCSALGTRDAESGERGLEDGHSWRGDVSPGLEDTSASEHRRKDREDLESEDERTVPAGVKPPTGLPTCSVPHWGSAKPPDQVPRTSRGDCRVTPMGHGQRASQSRRRAGDGDSRVCPAAGKPPSRRGASSRLLCLRERLTHFRRRA